MLTAVLAEPNLTPNKALEIAQAMETAERGSSDLQPALLSGVPLSVPVNTVGKQRTRMKTLLSPSGVKGNTWGPHASLQTQNVSIVGRKPHI